MRAVSIASGEKRDWLGTRHHAILRAFPLPLVLQSPVILSLVSVTLVSLVSLVGVLFFVFDERRVRKLLLFFVSFSTGAILGDVFLHIIPELAQQPESLTGAAPVILVGILFSFSVEKIIHWRHCHLLPADDHHHAHHHSVGIMSLMGEAVHNFVDGIIIGSSYLVSIPVGVSTTLAVVLHEIPTEIGDFAILLHSGFSRSRALLLNLLSALTAILGVVLVLVLSGFMESFTALLLPFAAGNLLYIAGSDLIPELHRQTGLRQGFLQLLCMIAGMGVMYAMLFVE